MDSARFYTGHFKNEAFRWKPVFTRRQTVVYPSENNRLVQDGPHPASKPDIIDTFVNNRCTDDTGRHLSRMLLLGKFLDDSDIELFGQQPDPSIFKPKVLLDDRNDESVTRTQLSGNCRPFRGPLTAHQLYYELLQQRLPIPRPPGTAAQPRFVAAERRLIYITDLDPHCCLALAATASPLQAAFLRDFLHSYLACRASIGVHVYSPGYSTFSLEFHLPYYAWRQMASKNEDERRKGDGTPLRIAEEVIHLQRKNQIQSEPTEFNDYIYEAESSVMVTGVDEWVWTAYCFVEVYFKGGRHSEDVNYLSQPTARWTGRLDPHSCGRYAADPPLWLPREYFLRALAARMEQVKQEWNNSVSRLLQGIEPYVYSFTREDTDIRKTGDLNMTQQKGFKWTVRVLRQFTNLISKTIAAWETFKDCEIRYFYVPQSDDSVGVSWGTYLAAIDKDVTELKDLRSSLQYQTDLFENMTTNLVTHAQHAEAIITREQSKFIQALTVITIVSQGADALKSSLKVLQQLMQLKFYLPPTLAATIFIALFGFTTLLVFNLPYLTPLAQSIHQDLTQFWVRLRSVRWRRVTETETDDSHEHEMDEPENGEDDRDV